MTLRALVLLPLFAFGTDQARASLVCGSDASRCLKLASETWVGVGGLAALFLLACLLAVGLVKAAARRATGPFGRWLIATLAILALVGAQSLMVAALGGGSALGGGWLAALGCSVIGGAVIALALRVAPAAVALVRDLGVAAPRARVRAGAALSSCVEHLRAPAPASVGSTPGRDPPAFSGIHMCPLARS